MIRTAIACAAWSSSIAAAVAAGPPPDAVAQAALESLLAGRAADSHRPVCISVGGADPSAAAWAVLYPRVPHALPHSHCRYDGATVARRRDGAPADFVDLHGFEFVSANVARIGYDLQAGTSTVRGARLTLELRHGHWTALPSELDQWVE